MEVRDWVQEVAKSHLRNLDDAMAVLRTRDPDGNWAVDSTDEGWWLLTGDQWVLTSTTEQEFVLSVIGVAVAVTLFTQ